MAMIRPVAPYFNYLLNKEYIAKNLCVNKDKPESHCEGKCHLVKELKKVNNPVPAPDQGNSPGIEIEKYPLALMTVIQIELKSKYTNEDHLMEYSFIVKSALNEKITPPPRFIS